MSGKAGGRHEVGIRDPVVRRECAGGRGGSRFPTDACRRVSGGGVHARPGYRPDIERAITTYRPRCDRGGAGIGRRRRSGFRAGFHAAAIGVIDRT